MYKRNISLDLKSAIQESPIVLLNGARQVGKSTLVKSFVGTPDVEIAYDAPVSYDNDIGYNGVFPHYLTLDDITLLASAKEDPTAFIEAARGKTVIDEIQRAPELFLAIKKQVDENRTPGRFLLTGSADVLALPKISESLAGRMEIHTLWPLSQGEIEGRKEYFIDYCFSNETLPSVPSLSWQEIGERMQRGGYPESLIRQDPRRRNAWFRSYLSAIVQRDIRDLADIEGYTKLPNLLHMLSLRIGGMQNLSELGAASALKHSTTTRYITLLQAVFLYTPLSAWYKSEEKRLVKSPKIYLNDTGIASHLRGAKAVPSIPGKGEGFMLENFILNELRKQATWSEIQPRFYHFRTESQKEVDIVVEAPDGRIVGIECKASSSVSAKDFSGLKELATLAGDAFHRGFILYTGKETAGFGEKLAALPVSALWQVSAPQ